MHSAVKKTFGVSNSRASTHTRNQKAEFQKKVSELGNEATYVKLEAHKEKMQTVEAFKAREQALKEEMAALSAKLMEEKELVFQNQLVTNRILETRIELDAALGTLKKQLEQERKDWEGKLAAEKELHAQEMQKLVEAQEARSREMMKYAEVNRELESKLAAEQEARSREVMMYELAKEELGSKLSAEQEARSRDLKMLSAEQEAYNRDLMKYEQVSKELASKLAAEQDARTRDVTMLTAEQEARQRDLMKSQEVSWHVEVDWIFFRELHSYPSLATDQSTRDDPAYSAETHCSSTRKQQFGGHAEGRKRCSRS
jgi:hypothetical protein